VTLLRQEGWTRRPTVGAVQPEEEKALGTPYSSLSVPEGGLQESWRGTLYKAVE